MTSGINDPGDMKAEYVAHDYSAINSHVNGLSRLIDAKLAERKSSLFSVYAIYGSGFVVALGLATLLATWGISLLRDPKIVTAEKIVEKQVAFKPIINVTLPDEVDKVRGTAAQRMSVLQDGLGTAKSVFNFVIFRDILFKQDGFSSVVIGMRFKDQDSSSPDSQWCYIERGDFLAERSTDHVSLASKANGTVSYTQLTNAHASKLKTTLSVLKKAQGLCVFK
tara:strand:+ start:1099 stop:1767 length:669 start_codon:yes stop_codon:yes gene_type:complete